MGYRCPKCYGTTVVTERRPNGDSTCKTCVHIAPTSTFLMDNDKPPTRLVDVLAKLEHEQWRSWALSIMDSEPISESRKARWKSLIDRGFDNLTNHEQESDYAYAVKVLSAVKIHLGVV